jgi:L-lactate dehydrogenase
MKIGVVGCGQVGSASAYACVLRGVGTEIVLVDKNPALAEAQAEDILHATPFASPVRCRAGTYEDLQNAGIVMIAAGVGQKPGETRLDLLKRNAEIFSQMIPQILRFAPEAILLNATNPVDIMTHLTIRFARECRGSAIHRIIGSGTILDTARFRSLLGQHLGVSSHSIHANVLGEHGDSEVLHWSGATVGNVPLAHFAVQVDAPVTQGVREQIDDGVRRAAYRIIQGKGATWYGVGAAMARIAQAIVADEHAVLTCSAPVSGIPGIPEVSLSIPRLIAKTGIERAIHPELDERESAAFQQSAGILWDALEKLH